MRDKLVLPKISIVVPMYNASYEIEECLVSIFNATFKDFEVILVDDCSTDKTIEIASKFSCIVLKNEINKGPAFSRNKGVNQAQANIVMFVDSDILLPADVIGKVWDYFESSPQISVLQGCYGSVAYYKNIFSQYKHYIFSFRGLMDSDAYINYVHTACVAIRRDVFKKVKFNENLRRREDIEFGLRCINNRYSIYSYGEFVVDHKKKYDLISFSKYQFNTARELILQYFVFKDRNISKEISSEDQPLYKKLWFLRPVISFIFCLNLIWLGFQSSFLQWVLLSCILLLSFLVEYQFRLYLFRIAPLSVSLCSFFLYFYDGLLIGLGSIVGLLQAINLKLLKRAL